MKSGLGGGVVVWVTIAAAVSMASAQTVGWVGGESFGGDWMVFPESGPIGQMVFPATDPLFFSGPLTSVFGNSCEAERLGGGAVSLGIDQAAREIEIYFEPPAPDDCFAVYLPVCGLQGQFGPLAAGDWVFSANSPWVVNFSLSFTVTDELDLGDIDGDGDVDLDDFVCLKECWGKKCDDWQWGAYSCSRADLDNDCDVDLDDFVIFKNSFFGTGTGVGTVPEPATMLLLALGAAAVVRRRR